MKALKRTGLSAVFFLFTTGVLCFFSGRSFQAMHHPEPLYPRAGLTARRQLSDYFPPLKRTHGDTEVYLFRGKEKGGNLLVLGGTHPNEPAGLVASVLLIENIRAEQGNVFIIPRANA